MDTIATLVSSPVMVPLYSAGMAQVPSSSSGRAARMARAMVTRVRRRPVLRRVLLHPVVSLPGFWFATAGATVYALVLNRARLRRYGALVVAERMPSWSFGRGGTTVGAVYLTRGNTSPDVLQHEAVHVKQWRRYGIAFIPLYIAAGAIATQNRFEIEAGLEKGGYT